MRNLLLISVLSVLFSACNFSLYHPGKRLKETRTDLRLTSYFNQPDSNYLYLSEIRFLKNYFSGITAIKPQNDTIHRLVFVTEMGMKIFDFEITNPLLNKKFYKIHYIMEPLSRKIILRSLANDFGLLLQDATASSRKYFITKKDEMVVKIKAHGLRFYYIFEKDKTNYKTIRIESCLLKKARVDIWTEQNNMPDSLHIKHYGIKLNYIFRKLKQ